MKMKKSVFMLIVMLMSTFTQLATSIGTIQAYAETDKQEVAKIASSEPNNAIEESTSQSSTTEISSETNEAESTTRENEELTDTLTSEGLENEDAETKELARAGGRDITSLDEAYMLPKDKDGNPTILTDTEMTLNGKTITEVNPLSIGDEFQINYTFRIPDAFGKKMLDEDYYQFKLPSSDVISLTREQSGDLIDPDNGVIYGKYYGYTNGDVRMVFNEEVRKNDDVDGKLMFSMKVDEHKVTIPGGYEIEIPFVSNDSSEMIYVTSNIKSYIQKQYMGLNGDVPEWKVLINPNSLKMNHLKLNEETTYRYYNSDVEAAKEIRITKMKKAKVNLKGEITEGDEVSISNQVFDQNGNIDLGFDSIEEPYVLYIETPLKFGVVGKITNRITLTSDTDNGNYLKETASASQQLGQEVIAKEAGDYNKKDGIIDWKITYNPKGIHIDQKDAKFTDTMTNGTLVEDSMTVSPNLPHEVKVSDDKKSFDFEFKTDVNEPVTITYKAKVTNKDEKFTVNDVLSGGQKVIASKDISVGGGNGGDGDGDGDGKSSISKSKPIDSQGGALWELTINKEKQKLDKWWVEDEVDTGMIRKSSLVFKRLPYGEIVKPSDYDIEWKDIDNMPGYATGFKITYKNPTSDAFTIKYITDFERNTIQNNKANYHYFVEGNEKEDDDKEQYIPKPTAEIGLSKSGRFIPGDNEIEWSVVLNEKGTVAVGPNNLLTDPIKDDQTYVDGSAKVQYKSYGVWVDSVGEKIEFNHSKNQLEVSGFMENKYVQQVIFRTKLKNPLDVVDHEIFNTAYYEDKYTPKKEATGSLKGNIGNDLFLKKEGKTNPANPNLIDWHVDVNPHGYKLRDLEIFDDSWENQIVIRDTIRLTDSSGNTLVEGYDYILDYTERQFHIKMLHDIEEKLDLTYQGRIVFPSGTIPGENKPVKNKIRMTAKDVHTTANPIEVSVPVKVPDSSGTIQGRTRNLRVKKVSAENQNQVLKGAEFTLYRGIIKDPAKVVDRAVSDGSGNALFTKLTKGDYLLVENKAPAGYNISNEMKTGRVVTISDNETTELEEVVVNSQGGEELTEFPVEKKWKNVPSSVKKPEVTVRLFANDKEKDSMVLNEGNTYKGTFKDLPLNENNKPILYTVKEDPIINYDTEINDGTITNTYNNQEKVTISGEKIWKDDESVKDNRPDKVPIELLQNGHSFKETEAFKNDNWKYEFKDLPKVDNGTGEDYQYTVKEVNVPDGYESTVNKYDITNTYTKSETTSVKGKKIWEDNNNRPGKRPNNITVELHQDGKYYSETKAEASEGWNYEFNGLPKKEGNHEFEYTVKEKNVPDGYESTVEGDNIRNVYSELEVVSVSGEKKWEGDTTNDRPGKVTVKLLKNGSFYQRKDVTSDDNWKYTFDNLPKYKDNSNDENVYTVEEENVPNGYTSVVDGKDIINHFEPEEEELVDIDGEKIWEDQNNKLNLRPKEIIVDLYQKGFDGQKDTRIDYQIVKGSMMSSKWYYSFENLPKHDNKKREITYYVEEREEYDHYESSSSDKYNIKNTLIREKTELSGKKEWYDDTEKDRPSSITVNLYGESKGKKEKVASQKVTSNNNWAYKFTNLNKHDDELNVIKYTVEEEPVEGYTTKIDGTTIKNYLEEGEFIDLQGEKHWVGDSPSYRPERILVKLYQNDREVDRKWVEPGPDGRWLYEFNGMPRKDENGKPYNYHVEEFLVPVAYESTSNGMDITNTFLDRELIDIKGKKYWNDFDGTIGGRPLTLQITLERKDPKTGKWKWVERNVIKGPDWAYEFKDQEKMNLDNQLYEYRVVESGGEALQAYDTESIGADLVNTAKNKKTSIDFRKIWEHYPFDKSVRPESIVVHLLQNGKQIETKILTEDDEVFKNAWGVKFENLDVYNMKTGKKYIYTCVEEAVPNFESESNSNGTTITNYYKPTGTINVEGEKIWEDNNNSFESRPEEIIVDLIQNGKVYDSQTVTSAAKWKYSFMDLPKYGDDKKENIYEVKERNVPAGYESQVLGFDITNVYKNTEVTSLSGKKIWDDYDNKFNTRPNEITVNLYQNNKFKERQQVKPDNNGDWNYKFDNLQVYDNFGKKYVYRVEEQNVPGDYESKVEGTTITNTYRNSDKTEISGEKIWNDYNNKFKKRPDSITVELLKNGEVFKTQKVTPDKNGHWKYSFTDLDMYDADGEEIKYTVNEISVPEYTTEVKGDNIFNTYVNKETTKISVEKKWDDLNNSAKIRPKKIDAVLLQNGKEKERVELKEENNWSHTFDNLEKYDNNGNEFEYTVIESGIPNYLTTYEATDGKVTITNKLNDETKVDISGLKIWDDYNNALGTRTGEVTILLFQNEKPMLDENNKQVKTTTNEEKGWHYSFTDLPKRDNETAKDYVYSVEEEKIPGYETIIEPGSTNITNKYRNHEKVKINAEKHWEDYGNKFNTRSKEITIHLTRDNKVIDSAKLNDKNKFKHEFENLAKYDDNGVLYAYDIVEDVPDPYTLEKESMVDGDTTTIKLTNTYVNKEKVEVSGEKFWDDYGNKFKNRPNQITVQLFRNDEKTPHAQQQVTADSNWQYRFTDLEKYDAKGDLYTYEVKEVIIDTSVNSVKYETEYIGNDIVNHYVNDKKIKFSGEKIWEDYGNKFETRPEEVTLYLLQNNKKIDEVIADKDNKWKYEFNNEGKGYPVYDDKGDVYNYRVLEKDVQGYVTTIKNPGKDIEKEEEISGYNVVNKYENTETTQIKGSKTWDDFNNAHKKRPQEIEIRLFKNGMDTGKTTKATEKNNWYYEFNDLRVYDDDGIPFTYTVEEGAVDGYEQVQGGPNFVNRSKLVDAKTFIRGKKIWKGDNNNQLGTRPDKVTVVLYQNDIPMIDEDSKAVTQEASIVDNWSYEFDDLPKYDGDGKLYKYTVRELPVDGYSASSDGKNITNTYQNLETTEVIGQKTWDDLDNKANTRPDSIVVELYQNNEKVDEQTVKPDDSGDWHYEFKPLPKYDDNLTPYEYKVKEQSVPHYESSIEDNNIKNKYLNDEITEIKGEKIWLDMDDKLGVRPSSIKVELYQNGKLLEDKTQTVKPDKSGKWYYHFDNLPKNDDKFEAYKYTVKEVLPEDSSYQSEIEGTTIYNTYLNNDKTTVKGVKKWEDFNNKLNKRPESITVYLYRNNGLIPYKKQTVISDTNGFWHYEFNDLPKYDKLLNEYQYTVKEGKVKGYTSEVKPGASLNESTITNTYQNNDVTSINGYKVWKGDFDNKIKSRPESITIELYQTDPKNIANPQKMNEAEVKPDEQGIWYYEFNDLPKYNDELGEYLYTVKEKDVAHYESEVDGTNVVNTYINDDKTSINIKKDWVDLNNKLGTRPESITIDLYQNDYKMKDKTQLMTPDANGNWSHEYVDLPKYDKNLNEYKYTVKETKVAGYEPDYQTDNGELTITNYYQNQEKTKVVGKKIWDDKSDKLNTRPAVIQVDLYQRSKNSVTKKLYATQFVKSNGTDEWTYEFDNLPKYDNKLNEYNYTVKERDVADYDSQVSGFDITNTYKNNQVIGIKGEKNWEDFDDKLGVRPTTIYVDLYRNDGEKPFATEVVEADENGKWEYEFVNLPKYDEELTEYNYEIRERKVPHYDTELVDTTITNTYRNDEKISLNGEKKWKDVDNKLKTRPKTIQVDLYRNDEKKPIDSKTVKANKAGHWRYQFKNLPKYDEELNEIHYTVKEQEVKDYDSKIEGTTITNTYQNKETTSLKGEKRWEDKLNKLNSRPESITVNLHQNGSKEVFASQKVTPDAEGYWDYEFKDLPKYDDKLNLYQYTVSEEEVPHYNSIVEGTIITNQYVNNEKTEVAGKKVWDDEDNKLNLRPKAIKVELYQNEGKTPIATKTVRAGKDGNWNYQFTNLPKYDDNLEEYRYTVKEQDVTHYEGKVEGTIITNTYINDETTELKGEKKWDDKDNKLNVRPKAIKVDLYQNGVKLPEKTETVTPDESGNWLYSFKNLPKYDKELNEFDYTVKEQVVPHYEGKVEGTTITNTYLNDEETELTGQKTWKDEGNKLNTRPESIQVELYQNDGEKPFETQTVTPDKKGNWFYRFDHLPKYDEDYDAYRYTVKEKSVPHYESKVEGTNIVNTYQNTELTAIKGEKQWNDSNNHLNTRPDSIKVDLYQNGVLMIGKTQEVKADESGKWFYEFADLPKYDNSLNEYQYSVREQSVTDYRSLVEGTTIVNTYKNEKTINLKGKKEWQDFGNKQNTRPESIHVELYQNDGEKPFRVLPVTPNEAGQWFYEFKDLPQYDENLNEITYTVKEKNVPHYESHVEGTTITNTYQNIDKTTIKGEKQWIDEDNKLNTRPEFIQVELYQNGVKMEDKTQQVTPDKKGKWYYEFTDLPKYDAKLNEYKYTVKEQKVSHYDGKVNESNTLITNTYRNDELTKISGQKLWKDEDNKYQTRPDLITVELYQNDSKVPLKTQQVKPNKAGEWQFEFEDLPKYDSELNEFKYTLKEVSVKNYTSKVEGTTITNTLTKETEPGKKPKPFLPNTGSLGKRPNRLPKTGEVNDQPFLTALMGLSLITFAGVGIFFRRKN
ncbi:Cna B-type domain-containing protein [Vagococcus carniphilus]|nr:Cna B-type domain-containing protein [Vagococcus carniphilus]